jgi:dienelactone hydrolase
MNRTSVHGLLAAVAFCVAAALPAQDQQHTGKRALTHDDYDQWKSLRGTAYSRDGMWIAYQIEPQWGDGVLEIRQTQGDVVHRHPLGSGAKFSADGKFAVFTIGKSKVEERQKKIEELKKPKPAPGSERPAGEGGETRGEPGTGAPGAGATGGPPGGMPPGFAGRGGRGGGGARGGGRFPGMGGGAGGDSEVESSRDRGDLAILDLQTGKLEVVKRVKGFSMPEELNFLVYHMDRPEEPKPEDKPAEKPAEGMGEAGKPAAKKPGAERATEKSGEKSAENPEAKPAAKGAEQPAGKPAEKPAEKPEEKPAEKPTAEVPAEKPATGKPAEPAAETPPSGGEARGGRGQGQRGGRRGGGPGAAGGGSSREPEDPIAKKRQDGTVLVVRNLDTGREHRYEDVVGYGFTRKAKWMWLHTCAKKPDAKKQYGLFVTALADGALQQLLDGAVNIGGVTATRDESKLAFTSDKDDFAAEKPRSDLWLWSGGKAMAQRIAAPGMAGMPFGKHVAGSLSWSRDGSVLEFAVQDPPADELPAILPEDKVTLDLWHWNDPQLQPQQARRGGGSRSPWSCVYHVAEGRIRAIGDETVEQIRFVTPDGSRALGTDNTPYEKLTTWDGRYSDVWLVNTIDGTRTKVLEKLRGNVSNSPTGRYLLWFGSDYRWWSYDLQSKERRDLTGPIAVPFHRHDDDHPEPDAAYGIAGWTKDDDAVLVYDEFDLWKVTPRTGEAVCVTDGYGREHRLRLRIQSFPREEEHQPEDLVLAATSLETMAEGFFADSLVKPQKPRRLTLRDKNLGELSKPKNADRYFFTVGTFAEFPDLWTAKTDFTGARRLTDANPQQSQFRWGRSELVSWINGDGKRLQGVLVKPDDFDPEQKYPMMVYFYEKSSQNLHNYVAPSPGTSPNAAYYVSNGYLWFMPDIVYDVGYPGESCVKCVVAGVQHLIAQGFVDERRIGAAGHSWGGYQTAFLVTRTNIFAAVESGAPVSNMISAYGGIRYESGVSRQFQYEQTQSRIGGTPWQYPLRYWENSPIFFADKVRTPVLILHNDQDGAVPWTNGIEYFTALRRLGKECYLFNYTGEGHGLTKRQNQKDWARRMAEYFDHHLKGAPMPKWMKEGVPYSERDKEKLPHAPSFIEAWVKPKTQKPAEAPAKPAEAKPAEGIGSAGGGGGQDRPQDPQPQPQKPVPPSMPTGKGDGHAKGEAPVDAKAQAAETGGKNTDKGVTPMLEPGKQAPDFAIADETGKVHKLADYQGKTLVLWFYPMADTPG